MNIILVLSTNSNLQFNIIISVSDISISLESSIISEIVQSSLNSSNSESSSSEDNITSERQNVINSIIEFGLRFKLPLVGYESLLKLIRNLPGLSETLLTSLPRNFKEILNEKIGLNDITYNYICRKCSNIQDREFGSPPEMACFFCNSTIPQNTDFFVYIGVEKQLSKCVSQNISDILSYRQKIIAGSSGCSLRYMGWKNFKGSNLK